MKYTIQALKYILKNFLYIFPFAVLPALLLSISTDESAMISALQKYATENIQDWEFGELFRAISVLNFGSWQSVVSGLLGVVVIIICVALMMALIEKHFRIGKRTFNGIFSKLNDNLISTAGYIFLLLIIYEVWAMLLAAFLFVMSEIPYNVVAYPIVIFFFLAMHILLIYTISVIYLWLSCMQITGFKALEALHYSYQLMTPLKIKLIAVQLLSLFVVELLVCLCVIFLTANPIVFTILTTLLYTSMIMFYCVRMQIVYFDRDNIERADQRKY